MFTELMVIGGLFWSLTYIFIIRRGFKDKTYGMPLAALCTNISWEVIFSFIYPPSPPQIYVNYVWFSLDVIIIIQFLKFGVSEFPKFPSKHLYFMFSLAIVTAFCLVLFISQEFKDLLGVYAAFGQNFMMSILFIAMIFNRSNLRGQSIYIALFKMLGTGFASLAFYLYQPISQGSVLLPFLYVSIFICDVVYVVLIYKKHKEQDLSIWRRL